MIEKLKRWLISIWPDVRQWLVGAVLSGILYAVIYRLSIYYGFAYKPIPVWVAILLFLICCLNMYFMYRLYNKSQIPVTKEDLYEAYGVYWNKDFNKRCLYCKSPLKYSTNKDNPSIFFCSNRHDIKHVLRDKDGTFLIEDQAIDKIKKSGLWPR